MGLHLAPIAFVNIRRKYHEPFAAGSFRGFGLCDGFSGGQRGNCRHHWSASFQGANAIAQNRDLFIERKRGAFTERAERNDARAAVVHQPAAVIGHKSVIHFLALIETSGDRGHYAFPLHQNPPFNVALQNAMGSRQGSNNVQGKPAGARNRSPNRKEIRQRAHRRAPGKGPCRSARAIWPHARSHVRAIVRAARLRSGRPMCPGCARFFSSARNGKASFRMRTTFWYRARVGE